jgi:hypothetical protein
MKRYCDAIHNRLLLVFACSESSTAIVYSGFAIPGQAFSSYKLRKIRQRDWYLSDYDWC